MAQAWLGPAVGNAIRVIYPHFSALHGCILMLFLSGGDMAIGCPWPTLSSHLISGAEGKSVFFSNSSESPERTPCGWAQVTCPALSQSRCPRGGGVLIGPSQAHSP